MTSEPTTFSIKRTLKIGSFHIGSSAADLLTFGVWNRIMIVDLGISALPVALLSALRYLLAPLSLWSGHRSDVSPLFGSRRLSYIWLGRLGMALALPLLPVSTYLISQGAAGGWALATLAFVLFGSGTLISGPVYLALVHDSVPYARRGLAVGIVTFVLVGSFAFLPLMFSRALPAYDPVAFLQVAIVVALAAAALWIVSIWREERPSESSDRGPLKLRDSLSGIWSDPRSRRYAVFLAAAAFFAFMQDLILEPFGGDVFGLSVGETTRFNAFWGTGVIAGMLATMTVTRRWRPDQQVGTTTWGLVLLALPLAGLGAAARAEALGAVRPLLLLFGVGFGIYTAGGVSLLMAMSTESQAGSYLALWSVIQLLGRGAGIAFGGFARDAALALTGSFAQAYGAVFIVESVGVLTCVWLLRRVDVAGFVAARGRRALQHALSAAD